MLYNEHIRVLHAQNRFSSYAALNRLQTMISNEYSTLCHESNTIWKPIIELDWSLPRYGSIYLFQCLYNCHVPSE
jgi:hypothetical protein